MGNDVPGNLLEIQQRIAEATRRSGRAEGACELLVVSKTWPADRVAEVAAAGQVLFGENKVQEAEQKVPALSPDLHWHLIGHLQRNKSRKALGLFGTIHSIDSLKLARYVSNIAEEMGKKPQVYLQVNLAGEESKNGYDMDVLRSEYGNLLGLGGIDIVGLMCIPPAVQTPEEARP